MCSGKHNRESEGRDHDARGEENGELLTGVAHGVRVVHQPPGYAVWDGREDVKEEDEEGPVLAGRESGVSDGVVSHATFQPDQRTITG